MSKIRNRGKRKGPKRNYSVDPSLTDQFIRAIAAIPQRKWWTLPVPKIDAERL